MVAALKTVVVIDDNPRVLQNASMEIEICGFESKVFHDPILFLSCASDLPPCPILLDLMMPRMSGLDVLKELRARHLNYFSVLVFTSIDDPSFRQQALDLGADRYVLKPEFFDSPCALVAPFF